jgi:hypothetical protein
MLSRVIRFSRAVSSTCRTQRFVSASLPAVVAGSRYQDGSSRNNHLQLLISAAIGATACYSAVSTAHSDVDKKNADTSVDKWAHTKLYPAIEASHSGFIKVNDVHSIHYEEYGNPRGKPVLFVHGGPGGGTVPAMARFFDPAAYRIILVDQRGCGKSVPFADLTNNTTYDSVRDFELVRKHLGINKWQVFGGSWGSTLGLAYAV